jgi:drug/metabolite transporter (DMT)-like permease
MAGLCVIRPAMALWIPITVAAAFFQNLRFMLQKHLRATSLTTAGATFSRFVFAAPLAIALVAIYSSVTGAAMPATGLRFFAFAAIGGLAQIFATMLVVELFTERNFAVGITFKKTETMQAALFGLIVLGDRISLGGFLALLVGLVGVVLLSDPPKIIGQGRFFRRIFNRAALLGLASGALFGVSGIAYRAASLSLEADTLMRAALTLACVTSFQAIAMAGYLRMAQAGQVAKVLRNWKITGLVGSLGMLGSLCWFLAFTLQNVAYVKALGQIELVFTFLGSYLIFKERSNRRELAGIALVVGSIVLLILVI